MVKSIEMIIRGKVQKVGFRACIKKIASDLTITGTVTNLSDGRVQVQATGDEMILEKFVSMVYSCPRAIIRNVRLTEIPIRIFLDFSVIKSDNQISTEL